MCKSLFEFLTTVNKFIDQGKKNAKLFYCERHKHNKNLEQL